MNNPMFDAARDWQSEQSRESELLRRDQRTEQFFGEGWPELPAIQPISVRPVQLSAPEFTRKRFGICPECPELDVIDLSRHVCPAKD